MRKTISALTALAAAASLGMAASAAEARPFHHHGGWHHAYSHHHYRHGRGYWRDGRWIGLGIGAALAAGAAGAYYDRDCYWDDGYRYCD